MIGKQSKLIYNILFLQFLPYFFLKKDLYMEGRLLEVVDALHARFKKRLDDKEDPESVLPSLLSYVAGVDVSHKVRCFRHHMHMLFVRELIDRGEIITNKIFREIDGQKIFSWNVYDKISIALLHAGADPNTQKYYITPSSNSYLMFTDCISLTRFSAFITAGICDDGIRSAIRVWRNEMKYSDRYLDVEKSFILTFLVESFY